MRAWSGEVEIMFVSLLPACTQRDQSPGARSSPWSRELNQFVGL